MEEGDVRRQRLIPALAAVTLLCGAGCEFELRGGTASEAADSDPGAQPGPLGDTTAVVDPPASDPGDPPASGPEAPTTPGAGDGPAGSDDPAAPATKPGPAPFSFFALGDTRSDPDRAQMNFQSMTSLDPNAIAVFNSGDLTADGEVDQWNDHVQAVNLGSAGKIRLDLTDWAPGQLRYFGVVGNHDVHVSDWLKNWNDNLPGQQGLSNSGGDAVYFSVTYGNALFIVLDSQNDSDAETVWLEQTLASAGPEIEWKFVFYHHPVFPCNYKSPWSGGVEWTKLFEKHGVDLVFNGHAHVYERSCPMVGGQCQTGGVTYVISGGGGAGTNDVEPNKKDSVGGISYDCAETLASAVGNWHHYCQVKLDGKQLSYACYSHDSTTNPEDSFTLVKK